MPDFPPHDGDDIERRRAEYRAHLDARRTPKGEPSPWPYPIARQAARIFESLPERFLLADLARVARKPLQRGTTVEEELERFLAQYLAQGMAVTDDEAAEAGIEGAYRKTGVKPYRTDLGRLSGGNN
jgi:hypothetical protein